MGLIRWPTATLVYQQPTCRYVSCAATSWTNIEVRILANVDVKHDT